MEKYASLLKVLSKFLSKLATTLSKEHETLDARLLNEKTDKYFALLLKMLKNHGPVQTIKEVKLLRLAFTRWLVDDPLAPGPHFTKLNKSGYPVRLSFLKPNKSNYAELRYILTVLTVTRCFVDNVPFDTESITHVSRSEDDIYIHDFEIKSAILTLVSEKEILRIVTQFKAFQPSNKSSPSGSPALLTSLREAKILVKDEAKLNAFKVFAGDTLVNNLKLTSVYADMEKVMTAKLEENTSKSKKEVLSRLAVIPDKELKMRQVGILDYWSQSALYEFHNSLMKILSSLPEDMTYNQANIPLDQIGQDKVHSLDLSNATDRFPLSFQKRVVEMLLGKEKAASWSFIIANRDFKLFGGDAGPRTLLYGAGQPLGAYSSWATFAFCHHLIVAIAARRAKKRFSKQTSEARTRFKPRPYRVLGDDIIVWDSLIAHEYKNLMKILDVEISKSKTHTSEKGFELAKRWFIRSDTYSPFVELTPFPVSGIVKSIKSPIDLSSYFLSSRRQGWSFYTDRLIHPESLLSFCKIFKVPVKNKKRYIEDFEYTLFGLSDFKDVSVFSRRFYYLDTHFSQNINRFESMIREAYVFVKCDQFISDVIAYKWAYLQPFLSNEGKRSYEALDVIRQGDPTFPGNFRADKALPMVGAWNVKLVEYLKLSKDVIELLKVSGNSSMSLALSMKKIITLMGLKEYQPLQRALTLDQLDKFSRQSVRLNLTAKTTRRIIEIIRTGVSPYAELIDKTKGL